MAPELGASGDWNRGAIGTGIGGADGISVWKRLSSLSSGDEWEPVSWNQVEMACSMLFHSRSLMNWLSAPALVGMTKVCADLVRQLSDWQKCAAILCTRIKDFKFYSSYLSMNMYSSTAPCTMWQPVTTAAYILYIIQNVNIKWSFHKWLFYSCCVKTVCKTTVQKAQSLALSQMKHYTQSDKANVFIWLERKLKPLSKSP